MRSFAVSGKRKIYLDLPFSKFLFQKPGKNSLGKAHIHKALDSFFKKNKKAFLGKRVCVVIPDHTRHYHPQLILPAISKYIKRYSREVLFLMALGLHRPLNRPELQDFLGRYFLVSNNLALHDLKKVRHLGKAFGVPIYINEKILASDVIFTIGVVEPHLYAGFSGGTKCIGVGLAGRDTILATHSQEFFAKPGVKVANIANNPFQAVMWAAARMLKKPIYSLNMVKDIEGNIDDFFLGAARQSFSKAARRAKAVFSYKVNDIFDILLIGCDYPKEESLYQASRLFNYVIEKKPIVRKGGAIFVFAGLGAKDKSASEKNFETALRQKFGPHYGFKKPGEHRAFKVIEAARHANLGIITTNMPRQKFRHISFFKDYRAALAWARRNISPAGKIGVIPGGFSFIPV